MLAASKITRQAMGDPTLRPATTTYKTSPYLLQNDRMSEDLPFGSRGGLADSPQFPLDGEYVIKVTLEGSSDHPVEIRLDRARAASCFAPEAGRRPKEVSIAVKAGTRLVAASFVGAFDRRCRLTAGRPTSPSRALSSRQSGVDNVQITGPYNGQVLAETPTRAKVFVCQPADAAQEKPCAKQILRHAGATGVSAAGDGRGRVAAAGDLRGRAAQGRFRNGHPLGASNRCWCPRSSCFGWSSSPRAAVARQAVSRERSGAGVAAVVLPVEQHSR